jgi:type II secretory pathway pseudopilin PulG
MNWLRQLDRKQPDARRAGAPVGEEGFMLLAVVVMVALLLIALSVAAPIVARQLRREKEVESQHRMEQYVRAIQLYQRKFPGQYPPSIKALGNSNNVRFLRHVYVDPLTGKADYKLIHQGEQKTKIHVFFGQELGGLAASLGSAAGMQSSGGMGAMGGGVTTVNSTNALNSGFGGATLGAGTGASTTGTTDASGGTNGTTGTNGTASTNGTTGTSDSTGTSAFGDGTLGVIVGVGTSKSGTSITEPNGQTTYESWEFWYDPRIEMLKQAVNVTGGGMSSQSASSFGQNAVSGQPNSGAGGTNGSTGSNGFGSASFGSSSFGSSSTGSNGTSPTGTTGSANPNSSTPNPF